MGTVALSFGDKLKAKLEAQDIGVRTLAGRLSGGDPRRRDVIRRRLNKYIHEGANPTEPSRREIEAELGCEADELRGDSEDEEADQRMRRAFDLFRDLMLELQVPEQMPEQVKS